MRRWIIRFVILAVVVGLAGAGYFPLMAWLQQRAIPKYTTASVSRGRVETVVNSTGTVKPVRTVSVGAFTSGPILKVNVDFNSVVKKGDILATIDPKLAKAALARDKASLQSQEADSKRVQLLLKQAQNNLSRAEKLLKIKDDYISVTDMEQYRVSCATIEAQCDMAEAAIQLAKANLDNSEANLGYTNILAPQKEGEGSPSVLGASTVGLLASPLSQGSFLAASALFPGRTDVGRENEDVGIVIERKVDPGQTVAASFQTPELFVIALEMQKHMYVFASVDEADIGLIHAAKHNDRGVRFTIDAYPGELFKGKIHQIRSNSTTTQNVVTYPVIVDAPNEDMKLMPGMTANLSFQIEAKEDVLRVPVAALRFAPSAAQVRPEDRHYVETPKTGTPEATPIRSAAEKADQARSRQHRIVWVQDGPLLKAVPVTLGLTENQFAELAEGDLAEGQAVVTGTESLFGAR